MQIKVENENINAESWEIIYYREFNNTQEIDFFFN
jgi:hypothetical protein